MLCNFDELFNYEYWNKLGYIPGLGRDFPYPKKSHLYRGTYQDVKEPLCKKGWNRENGQSYSIWRNNIGEDGICCLCIKKARKELEEGK